MLERQKQLAVCRVEIKPMSERQAGLTIKVVAERTGVSVHTLRVWERRYGIPQPDRDAGNHYRLYDEQDIADVLWLKHQVESGISPALATALRRQEQAQSRTLAQTQSAQPLDTMRAVLEHALAASDESTVRRVLDQLFALYSPEQVAQQIIEPTMHELGARWQRNELDVWQEHLASNIVRQRILAFLQAQPEPPPTAPALVAACAPEEQHELGLLLFALFAQRQGWHVTYLGQRTPLANVLPLAAPNRWVALSVTTTTGLASLLPLLSEVNLPRARLLFGGYLFNQVPRLREHVPGVFLGASAQESIRTLNTREPQPNEWMPAKKYLRAALNLQSARLKLGWETIEHLASERTNKSQRWLDAQGLTMPTLFLIDALSSALAFQVPDLVDAQRFWLTQVMPPHGVSAQLINLYLDSFTRAAKHSLEQDTAQQVAGLIEHLTLDSIALAAANDSAE